MVNIRSEQDDMKEITATEEMRDVLREMVAGSLKAEHGDGHTWAGAIVKTLMQIAVTPDEYTEDASVNAARLLWEILRNG